MLFELLKLVLIIFFRILGFGIKGEGEFEESKIFRKKINSRIQKEKSEGLPLFEGSYKEALNIAEEMNGILILIFLNRNSGDSLQFEKSVLKSETFKNQIKEVTFKTPIFVLFDISNQSHFYGSRQHGIKKYPTILIKTKLQEKFQTILCFEGFLDSEKLMSLIGSVLLACEAEIAQSAEISAMRALQDEQNSAYNKSLAIDKEKMKLKFNREEHNNLSEDEDINDKVIESDMNESGTVELNSLLIFEERVSRALLDLEEEPPISCNHFRFQFLFPDGRTRKIRSFSSDSTTKSLFDFVFSVGCLESEKIIIRSIDPPLEFIESSASDEQIILNQKFEGIGKGIQLYVEYI